MEKKTNERLRVQGRSVLKKTFFGFHALLVEFFSLRIRRVRGRGARHSTPTFATVLTVLTIDLT